MGSQDISKWRNSVHHFRHLLVDSPERPSRRRHADLLHDLDQWSTVIESGSGSAEYHEGQHANIQALVQDLEQVPGDLCKPVPTKLSISILILSSHDWKAVLLNINTGHYYFRGILAHV